jgi:hypothetical protein
MQDKVRLEVTNFPYSRHSSVHMPGDPQTSAVALSDCVLNITTPQSDAPSRQGPRRPITTLTMTMIAAAAMPKMTKSRSFRAEIGGGVGGRLLIKLARQCYSLLQRNWDARIWRKASP